MPPTSRCSRRSPPTRSRRPAAAQALHESASRSLADGSHFPSRPQSSSQEIAAKSEHLHHMDLAEARKEFKPISHAVVTLATQVRSEGAQESLHALLLPNGSRRRRRLAASRTTNCSIPTSAARCCAAVRRCSSFPPQGKPTSRPIRIKSIGQLSASQEGRCLTMLRALIEFCVRQPLLTLLGALAIAAIGGYCATGRADRCHSERRREPGHRLHRMARPLSQGRRRPGHLSALGRPAHRAACGKRARQEHVRLQLRAGHVCRRHRFLLGPFARAWSDWEPPSPRCRKA